MRNTKSTAEYGAQESPLAAWVLSKISDKGPRPASNGGPFVWCWPFGCNMPGTMALQRNGFCGKARSEKERREEARREEARRKKALHEKAW